MSKSFLPKGRSSLPQELLQFGRHLVYAEGIKTEPLYIESIKKEIADKYNCQQNDIEIISINDGKTHNTVYLVDYALEDVKKRLGIEQIDHVWIFFDKDDFPLENFKKANEKIKRLNNSKIKNNDGFKYNTETNIS